MTPIYYVAFSLFLTGIALSSGPCLITCGPLLVSYIASQANSVRNGIKIYFFFCLARVLAYGMIGILIGMAGHLFLDKIYQSKIVNYVFLAFGIFILFVGLSILIGKYNWDNKVCKRFENVFTKNKILNALIFGLGFGFSPCPPLLGVLANILLMSNTVWKGFLYSIAFGLGTIVSPLLLLAFFASSLDKIFKKSPKLLIYIRFICGLIIVFLGSQIIYRIVIF